MCWTSSVIRQVAPSGHRARVAAEPSAGLLPVRTVLPQEAGDPEQPLLPLGAAGGGVPLVGGLVDGAPPGVDLGADGRVEVVGRLDAAAHVQLRRPADGLAGRSRGDPGARREELAQLRGPRVEVQEEFQPDVAAEGRGLISRCRSQGRQQASQFAGIAVGAAGVLVLGGTLGFLVSKLLSTLSPSPQRLGFDHWVHGEGRDQVV